MRNLAVHLHFSLFALNFLVEYAEFKGSELVLVENTLNKVNEGDTVRCRHGNARLGFGQQSWAPSEGAIYADFSNELLV